ncbi:MAG: iron ABC transporter permease [Acidobacteriota bacterium]
MIRRGLLLSAGVLALMLASVALGSTPIPFGRVLSALAGSAGRLETYAVVDIRLPRMILAALSGVALGVAGVLLQRATRNGLASPGVLGIVDGAAVGVLSFLFLFTDDANLLTVSPAWQPLAAAVGALGFALTVGALARREVASPVGLILYGVALAALAHAFVVLLILAGPVHRASQGLLWLAGSLHGAEWSKALILAAALASTLPFLVLLVRPLDQLRLDDPSARSTGLAVDRTRVAALALSVLWTAAAVSVVGGVGFVGLIAPHGARLVFGARARGQLIGAALIGAGMVLAADLAVRLAFRELEVPAGAVTALIGAPYFFTLLFRYGRAHA